MSCDPSSETAKIKLNEFYKKTRQFEEYCTRKGISNKHLQHRQVDVPQKAVI